MFSDVKWSVLTVRVETVKRVRSVSLYQQLGDAIQMKEAMIPIPSLTWIMTGPETECLEEFISAFVCRKTFFRSIS